MAKHKTFKYTIELDQPMYPRHIADKMTMQGVFRKSLQAVTDLQDDTHCYGATYRMPVDSEPTQSIPHSELLAQYEVVSHSAEGEVERDVAAWFVALLENEWVPGNMGMVGAYLGEFIKELRKGRRPLRPYRQVCS